MYQGVMCPAVMYRVSGSSHQIVRWGSVGLIDIPVPLIYFA